MHVSKEAWSKRGHPTWVPSFSFFFIQSQFYLHLHI
jgi:hypothetical protein